MIKLSMFAVVIITTSVNLYAMDPQTEIAQLKAEFDHNVARFTSKVPSPKERFNLCSRNCQISRLLLEQAETLDQATQYRLNQEFERNRNRLQYISITPKESFELGKRNCQISKRLLELEQEQR